MTIDYDRQFLERATFADREAAQLDCARPTLRWFVVREGGAVVARVRAFTREAAVYVVTLARRKDSLSTTDLSAVQE